MIDQKRVEIIVVGNELLNGTTLDTNSFWLSKQCSKIGFKVERKITVRDELPEISLAFRQSISRRPDRIFSVGGLGPTYDDMTVRGLALALRRNLILDQKAVEMLRANYRRRALFFMRQTRRLSKSSLKMAMIPSGSKALPNPVGSAPAVQFTNGETKIVTLPGVPSEMKSIMIKEIIPIMRAETDFVRAEEWLKISGLSESRLSPIFTRMSKKYGDLIYIKSHPRGFENGKSVIHVQMVMTTHSIEKNAGLDKLSGATQKLGLEARKLGAEVLRLKSVR